ncbi:hypothetical protein ACSCBZ_46400 [Streptomyces niveiscabiei]|uniref:hypothetical protein n=1 Tax=Streptomyces niveiscabiei TaxID=164115 RepID=UPI00131CD5D0|nr:hypothetical protein [Streptomyces niveiscabiei]
MATLVIEQLRQWQSEDEGGPQTWSAAWEQAIDVAEPVWTGRDITWDGMQLAEGTVGLAAAFYRIAAQEGMPVGEITRDQVKALLSPQRGMRDSDVIAEWERCLRQLGHDPEDDTDRVSVRWQMLRRDVSPPEDLQFSLEYGHSEFRWGPALLDSLRALLAPIHGLEF